MKKMLQNFGSILSSLFVIFICNLAGFRNCLAEYTVHSLSCQPAMACLPHWGCWTVLADGV